MAVDNEKASYASYPSCDLSETLHHLAIRVAWLNPSHADPHAFHEAKSDIAGELRNLARTLING